MCSLANYNYDYCWLLELLPTPRWWEELLGLKERY